ncbi:MAG: BamA/TamA family outer membrane protein [Pseudomonadota bacterium]
MASSQGTAQAAGGEQPAAPGKGAAKAPEEPAEVTAVEPAEDIPEEPKDESSKEKEISPEKKKKPEKNNEEADEGDAPYPKYVLEKIVIKGNTKTVTSTILYFIPLKKGQSFSPDDKEIVKSRARLLATGWFSDVVFTLKKGSKKGHVILEVKVQERSTLLIKNLVLGISGITTYGGLELAEHNFLGRGLFLSGGFVVGSPHRGYRVEFYDPSLFNSAFSAGIALYHSSGVDYLGYDNVVAIYDDAEEAVYRPARIDYKRWGGSIFGGATIFKTLTLTLKYRLEYLDTILPIAATHTRRGITTPIDFGLLHGESYISTISASLTYDTRSDPFLPTSGLYLNITVELSNTLIGSSYNYSKYTLVADYYKTLPWSHIVKISFLAGLITGNAPLFEKFFIGDLSDFIPGRVQGMSFDKRRSFNLLKTSINAMRYENIAAKLAGEYIIPLYRKKKGIYGIDFFFSIGLFLLASSDDLLLPPEGYEDVSPAPIDITANLGFRADTSAGYFEVSVGTLLGLIPIEEELTLWR